VAFAALGVTPVAGVAADVVVRAVEEEAGIDERAGGVLIRVPPLRQARAIGVVTLDASRAALELAPLGAGTHEPMTLRRERNPPKSPQW
jgi:hypothetical protein